MKKQYGTHLPTTPHRIDPHTGPHLSVIEVDPHEGHPGYVRIIAHDTTGTATGHLDLTGAVALHEVQDFERVAAAGAGVIASHNQIKASDMSDPRNIQLAIDEAKREQDRGPVIPPYEARKRGSELRHAATTALQVQLTRAEELVNNRRRHAMQARKLRAELADARSLGLTDLSRLETEIDKHQGYADMLMDALADVEALREQMTIAYTKQPESWWLEEQEQKNNGS